MEAQERYKEGTKKVFICFQERRHFGCGSKGRYMVCVLVNNHAQLYCCLFYLDSGLFLILKHKCIQWKIAKLVYVNQDWVQMLFIFVFVFI